MLSLASFTTFGVLLKYLRQRQQLTQRDLGLAVGYGDAQINRLEHNLRLPDMGVVVAQFIVALHLEDEPLVAARLIELAAQARGESVPSSISFTTTSNTRQQHQLVEEIHIGVPSKRRSNLPSPLTNLIGRKREVAEVRQLLRENRLVTLTGAGGVGKTRLAQAAAADLLDTYADGVWWVELAALTDPAFVPDIIASTLMLKDQPGRAPMASITDYFEAKHALLILDNCEHLIAACADGAEHLLRFCPRLHILATSRETLRVSGEMLYRVPSLTTPQAAQDIANLDHYESVRLFIERAHAVQPEFELTASNATAVVQLCQRLDGIPLAIELAAARLKALTAEQIDARLADRFGLLTTGSRTALPRHQTLRATIDWSYALLSSAERVLLRRLSIFSGGWTLEAAEAVCTGGEVEPAQVLDLLTHLVDKSLLIVLSHAGETRFGMLETVREYAHQKVVASGELDAISEQHLNYILRLAEEIMPQPESHSGQSKEQLEKLEREHANLRSALRWAIEHSKTDSALRLGAATGPFWELRSYWREGRAWLERVLDVSRNTGSSSTSTVGYAQALLQDGVLAWRQCDYPVARELLERSLARFRELDHPSSIAATLEFLGGVTYEQGDYAAAQRVYEEALEMWRKLGNKRNIAYGLTDVGLALYNCGDWLTSRRLVEESIPLHREMGDQYGISYALNLLGNILFLQGDHAAAQIAYEEGLALRRELGNKRSIAATLDDLGNLRTSLGDYDVGQALYKESMSLFREIGNNRGLAGALSGFARIATHTGQLKPAAKLFGAVDTLLTQINAILDEPSHSANERVVAILRARLDQISFNNARKEGQAMTIEQAVAYALKYSAA